MHQRIGNGLDHRFVEFGVAPRDHQFDLLAQLFGEVADHALKAGEGVADGHHAQGQGAVPGLLDQIADALSGLHHGGGLLDVRRQLSAGTGDDEFANQVDQAVELVGAYLDEARLLGGAAFDIPALALCRGGGRRGGGGRGGVWLGRHRRGVGFAPAHALPDSSQFGPRGVGICAALKQGVPVRPWGVRGEHNDVAVVGAEIEDLLDGGLRGRALETDLDGNVAALRIQRIEQRDGVAAQIDLADLPQRIQVADEGQRIQPIAQRVAAEAQRQVPGAAARRGRVGRMGGGFWQQLCRLGATHGGTQLRTQALAGGRDGGVALAGANLFEQVLHLIAAAQQQGDHRLADRKLA